VKAITYTINKDIKALAEIIDLVLRDIMLVHFVCDDILFELKVVLNELITNALCHGNKCELDKVVYVTIKLVGYSYLYISVRDEGFGFKFKVNTKSIDDYLEKVNNALCEHGRGLVIVYSLCDKVKFNKCGNKVSILKNLNPL
jgi:serine/threonine-protein kinase RsbW